MIIGHPLRPTFSWLQRCVVLALLSIGAPVYAQLGPPGGVDEPPPARPAAIDRPSYAIALTLSVHQARRDDFSRHVLLFQQPVRRLEARELRYTLDFHLDLTTALYLRAQAPLSQRHVRAQVAELVVSEDEVLPPLMREISSFGLADPTLAVGYRPVIGKLELALELGTVIPVDDNPESNTFPAELPLGTGQSELFAAGGPSLHLDGFEAALEYRFGVFPGSPASYLVRRIGTQSFATGSLDRFIEHRLSGALAIELYEPVTLELGGDYRRSEQPGIKQRGEVFAFLPETHRDEIGAEAGLRFGVARGHEIALRYRHLFLEDWNEDPFFPVAIPDRGLSLSWTVRAR